MDAEAIANGTVAAALSGNVTFQAGCIRVWRLAFAFRRTSSLDDWTILSDPSERHRRAFQGMDSPSAFEIYSLPMREIDAILRVLEARIWTSLP
ncbi:hypothetical protein [Sinorhizobium psoraleae]|uniref:Uncharacterized protein n=1 Tax=Sinorhizobium psoraleae TaxID=520838 RepID=A0ABT4K9K9_9HYPH|nr:hypothetical protein [Sinorhizobium psoraleae]MCZ4088586.1 hypothetical protein [Sinorhizobium psoraleae]